MTPQETPGLTTSATGGAERGDVSQGQFEARKTAPTRSWEIVLPWSVPPVKPNGGHGNRYAHAAKVKQARQTMGLLARNAKIPKLARCEVLLTWYVPDRIARDADNLAWLLKPLCDALAGTRPGDHQIVHNDTPEYMTKHMPVIVYAPGQNKHFRILIKEIQ